MSKSPHLTEPEVRDKLLPVQPHAQMVAWLSATERLGLAADQAKTLQESGLTVPFWSPGGEPSPMLAIDLYILKLRQQESLRQEFYGADALDPFLCARRGVLEAVRFANKAVRRNDRARVCVETAVALDSFLSKLQLLEDLSQEVQESASTIHPRVTHLRAAFFAEYVMHPKDRASATTKDVWGAAFAESLGHTYSELTGKKPSSNSKLFPFFIEMAWRSIGGEDRKWARSIRNAVEKVSANLNTRQRFDVYCTPGEAKVRRERAFDSERSEIATANRTKNGSY